MPQILEASDILAARILIVDDQEANVQLLEQLLQETGYANVTASTHPTEVAALHHDNAYDLILLDLNMPLMNGFEVMQALALDENEPYLPVIALTADPGHKLRALQAGAKDFISKPFDLVEVKTRIHNMLEVRLLYKRLTRYNHTLEKQVQIRTKELAQSEERYRRLAELASDWYWEQNEAGNFTRVSGPVEQMLGIRVTAFWATLARVKLPDGTRLSGSNCRPKSLRASRSWILPSAASTRMARCRSFASVASRCLTANPATPDTGALVLKFTLDALQLRRDRGFCRQTFQQLIKNNVQCAVVFAGGCVDAAARLQRHQSEKPSSDCRHHLFGGGFGGGPQRAQSVSLQPPQTIGAA